MVGVGGLVGIQLRVHLLIDVSAEIYLETALRRPSRNHSLSVDSKKGNPISKKGSDPYNIRSGLSFRKLMSVG